MRKPALLAVTGIVSLGSLTLAACGSNSPASSGSPQAGTPITIGVSVSLTGDFSGDGKALVQGYNLWAQDENAKGGLLGHHVTMKYVDDASSTTQVVTNYQNLINVDKVALVFGPFSSLLTIPASTVTNRFGYAFPEPAGGGPSVFTRGIHSLFFVQPAPVEDNLVSFTQWVLSLPAGQRPATAAYSTEDDPFTQPQIDKAKALLEAGGVRTASYKVYPAETTDFTPLAQQVIAANADVVILGTQEPDAVAFIKAFQQQHYNPKALVETAGPDQGSDFANQGGECQYRGRDGAGGMVVEREDAVQRDVRQRIHRQVRRDAGRDLLRRGGGLQRRPGRRPGCAEGEQHHQHGAHRRTAHRYVPDHPGTDVVRFGRQAKRRKLSRPVAARPDRPRVPALGGCRSAGVPQARLLRGVTRRAE